MRLLTLPLSALLLAAAALTPRAAHAESAPAPPRCDVRVLPSGSIPANLPALIVDDRSSAGLKASITLVPRNDASSIDLDPIADPRDAAVTLLVPKKKDAIVAGSSYSVSYGIACSGGIAREDTGAASFTAGAAVPLPTQIGSLSRREDKQLVIKPTPELAAFLQVARFEVLVDGKSAGSTHYGAASGELIISVNAGYAALGTAPTNGPPPSVCATAPGTFEKHEVKVMAHVAGAATDPEPLTLPFDVDCQTKAQTILPDGGGDDRGASGDAADASSADGGGCAVSGTSPLGGLVLFSAVAGMVALARRRRTRR